MHKYTGRHNTQKPEFALLAGSWTIFCVFSCLFSDNAGKESLGVGAEIEFTKIKSQIVGLQYYCAEVSKIIDHHNVAKTGTKITYNGLT